MARSDQAKACLSSAHLISRPELSPPYGSESQICAQTLCKIYAHFAINRLDKEGLQSSFNEYRHCIYYYRARKISPGTGYSKKNTVTKSSLFMTLDLMRVVLFIDLEQFDLSDPYGCFRLYGKGMLFFFFLVLLF